MATRATRVLLTRRRTWVATALAGAACLLTAAPAAAQTAAIRVTVLSAEDDSPLPGTTVTVSNAQMLVAPTTVLTNARGVAAFPVLRAGAEYIVDVMLPGFAAQRRARIHLHSNSTEEMTFRLGAPLEERVQVVGGRDVVDLDEVGSSSRFSDEFLQSLPTVGRFYQEVLPLTPGVNDEDGDGNPNVHGSRSRDFRAEVSGVSNVDPLTGQWLSRVNPDTIEELEVIPRGAGVEFGRAQGGFARVIQKQGTNDFEGTLNFLYRSSKLDGDGAGNTSAINPAPEFETLQPAVQISGPIVRDKLWYRLSHERIDREEPVNVLGELAVTTFEQALSADQITWQVSPRNKLSLQYQNDPLTQDGLGLSSTVPLESTRTLEQGGDTWSLTWTAPNSARLLFDSTVAWQDHEVNVIPTTPDSVLLEQECVLFRNIPALLRTRCENTSTGLTSGPHFERSEDDRQRFTVKTQATLFQPVLGQSHRLKVGMIVEEEEYFRDLTRKPDVSFEIFTPPIGEPVGFATVRVPLPQVSAAKAEATNWAVYLEDQWKPRDNFSLTFGLRFDREEIDSLGRQHIDPAAEARIYNELLAQDGRPPESIPRTVRERYARAAFTAYEDVRALRELMAQALGRNANTIRLDDAMFESSLFMKTRDIEAIEIRNTNFSPRFSFAWDPWGNGKTKIGATAGRYYDKIFLAIPLVELEPVETVLNYVAPLRLPVPPFVFENDDTFATVSPLTARMVDRNLRTPYQDEYSIGFERELLPETSIKLTWLRRKFRDQFQDVDINQSPGDFGRCVFDFFNPTVVPSPGTGTIFDQFTFETYQDTDPGLGDGRLDDCGGEFGASTFGTFLVSRPDGEPDLYLQNPAWRELLLLGNVNTAEYEAFVVEVVRRMFRNWQLDASYTWSEAIGDAEDFDLLLGNEQNRMDDERGPLDYDQQHVLKLNAVALVRGWRIGSVLRWESGLPYSVLRNVNLGFTLPPLYPFEPEQSRLPRIRFPTGQRNDQRNRSYWTVDMRLEREFRIGSAVTFGVGVEVFNVLNDDVLRVDELSEGTISGTRRFGRQWQVELRMSF